ncbi:MAG: 7-cyano-7-deazaguanine synthase QueC [Candidatus Omnitrophica bacterium]|nr:7-cyano-7-deazaguanine synthase QueC [Candidatus Omnitrophota bacterium]
MKKAIVLLSGGMDSAVTLFMARKDHDVEALIFDYGQKASKEVDRAILVAGAAKVPYTVVDVELPWRGSSLTDPDIAIPTAEESEGAKIPSTYVPARNIIFLSYGVSLAEASGAEAVYIGAHQVDYSNYPDCRDVFFAGFRKTVEAGTRSGTEGASIRIETPILNFSKGDIVKKGVELGVPFELTWSCYDEGKTPCGRCESCVLRAKGFADALVPDPLLAKNE